MGSHCGRHRSTCSAGSVLQWGLLIFASAWATASAHSSRSIKAASWTPLPTQQQQQPSGFLTGAIQAGLKAFTAAAAAAPLAVQTQEQQPPVTRSDGPAAAGDVPYRIIGGEEALRDRYRFMCLLKDKKEFQYCGCSLVAPNVILTAAHCLNQPEPSMRNPTVEVGRFSKSALDSKVGKDYDRFRCNISVVHQAWSPTTTLNDIALCILDGASQFPPVRLAPEDMAVPPETNFTVIGWGSTKEGGAPVDVLMQTQVPLYNQQQCSSAYSNKIQGSQICAGLPQGGKDACQGDSGGPLLVAGKEPGSDTQVGIVSYGAGCGRAGFPGVYTDIRKYRKFIASALLARGVEYGPVTDGFAKDSSAGAGDAILLTPSDPAAAAAQDAECSCTLTGSSGSTTVSALGCQQHNLMLGDSSYFCYTAGGSKCSTATASNSFPGAAWKPCDPNVVSFSTAAKIGIIGRGAAGLGSQAAVAVTAGTAKSSPVMKMAAGPADVGVQAGQQGSGVDIWRALGQQAGAAVAGALGAVRG